MAIGFARCHFVQRSKGHSILLAAAYLARAKLGAPYPKVDYSTRRDLLVPMATLLPEAAPHAFEDPWHLWREVERASPRRDASLGLHLMLALPDPSELPPLLCASLVKSFVEDFILPHGLAASYALHDAHHMAQNQSMNWLEGGANKGSRATDTYRSNRHGHVLVSGRRIGPNGIDPRRYTSLDPVHIRDEGARGGVNWPELWRSHQNAFFARRGLGLRVRPQAQYSDFHQGPKGARSKKSPHAEVIERANRAAVSNPVQLLELVSTRPFTKRDLQELVDRYVPTQHPVLSDSVAAVLAMPNVFQLAYPGSGTASPWYATSELAQTERLCIDLAESMINRETTGIVGATRSLTLAEGRSWLESGRLAQFASRGIRVIEAVHGWPSFLGASFKTEILHRTYSFQPGSTVILDHADQLPAPALKKLLETVQSSDNVELVLLRRPRSMSCLRNPLLDKLARLAGAETEPAMVNSSMNKVNALANAGKIVFESRTKIPNKIRELYRLMVAMGKSPVVVSPGHELGALLKFEKIPVRDIAPPSDAILVHCEPSFGNLPLLGLLETIEEPYVLVDSGYCPDLMSLHEQVEFVSSLPCASQHTQYNRAQRKAAAEQPSVLSHVAREEHVLAYYFASRSAPVLEPALRRATLGLTEEIAVSTGLSKSGPPSDNRELSDSALGDTMVMPKDVELGKEDADTDASLEAQSAYRGPTP